MKKFWKFFIFVLLLVIIAGGIYYYFNQKKTDKDNASSDAEQTVYPEAQTPKPNEEIIKNWQNYSDSSGIFSLKYPDTLKLNSTDKNQSGKYLDISVAKISDLGTGAGIAERTKEALEKGKLGPEVSSAIKDSQKITNLDNGKVTSEQYVVATTDNCQVSISRELIFFWGENQVKITDLLPEPGNLLSDEFSKFDTTCNKKIWGDTATFYKKISAGQLSGEIQDWYNDFDEMVKSIKIK